MVVMEARGLERVRTMLLPVYPAPRNHIARDRSLEYFLVWLATKCE